jgi:outer membrane murein-binding lipoprotein Lpp
VECIYCDRDSRPAIDGRIARGGEDCGGFRGRGSYGSSICGGADTQRGETQQYGDDDEYDEHFRQREGEAERRRTDDLGWTSIARQPVAAVSHAAMLRVHADRVDIVSAPDRPFGCHFTFFGEITMRLAAVLLATLLLTSCRDPRAEANIAEAMIQVGTEISAMHQDFATLQNQVDSLRGVVAKQDTVIARLTTLANMPLPTK